MWDWLRQQVDVNSAWYGFWSGPGSLVIGGAVSATIALVGRWLAKHVRQHGIHIHHHHHGHDPSLGSAEVDHDSE